MPCFEGFSMLGAGSSTQNNPKEDRVVNKMEVDRPLFPPEVMETILSYIKDMNVLLECRLVCKCWNTWVCHLLEARSISHWTNYEQRKFNKAEIVPMSPLLEQKVNPRWGCFDLSYPEALKAWKRGRPNPFPSKSLTICRFPCLWDKEKPLDYDVIHLEGLFFRFGYFISSLNLVEVNTGGCDLDSMLAYLPNLKALTLNLIRVPRRRACVRWIDRISFCQCNKVSPSLEHLEILWYVPIPVAIWLLDLCAHQLVTLAVSTWNPLMRELCKRKFVNLKQFHMLTPIFGDFVDNWHVESAPALQNLTIMIDTTGGHTCQYDYAANFIAKFANTLVTLCINAKLVELENLTDYWEDSKTKFPNLKSLTLRDAGGGDDADNGGANDEPESTEDWKQVFLRLNAFSLFPIILSVKFKRFRMPKVSNLLQRSRKFVFPNFQIV